MVLFEGLTSSGKAKVVNVDEEGNLVSGSNGIPKQYVASDLDDSGGYYGFVTNGASGANWYIQKVTSTSIRYVSGSNGYSTAWSNRATLTYDYYYNVL
ncbi:MAG: hypothetical protein V7L26_17590 [Nostoc sp.]|uniref:hypothetical protein n=1 Tax=Nostoc sp. TaxID=1180 RepID=UPI002FF4F1CB